jgi:hypothetical protein
MYALAKSKKANTACMHQPCNHMLSGRFFIFATTAYLRISSLKNFSLKTTGIEPQILSDLTDLSIREIPVDVREAVLAQRRKTYDRSRARQINQ